MEGGPKLSVPNSLYTCMHFQIQRTQQLILAVAFLQSIYLSNVSWKHENSQRIS